MKMYQGFSQCRKTVLSVILFAVMLTFLGPVGGERALLFAQDPAQRGASLDL